MAGFRDFQTGEVLTAANVNDFLAKQSVMKFADATARDTALGTAVGGGNALREGMVAYLDDEDLPSFYNGTSWTTEFGGGGLVAVETVYKTDTWSASVASGAGTAVTGLSITHTVSNAANKILLIAFFGSADISGSAGTEGVGIACAVDGTLVGLGDAAGNRVRVAAGGRVAAAFNAVTMPSIHILYTPGDTSSHTYTVHAINIDTSTETLYVNRRADDADTALYQRSASALTLLEVKV